MTTQQLVDFLKQNEDLVKNISGETDSIANLFQKVDANRAQAQALLPAVGLNVHVLGSGNEDVQGRQRDLVAKIADASQNILKFQDEPDVQAGLLAREAALYMALADTYDDSFARIVTFTQDQIDNLNALLKQAKLDAIARQRQADVLNAAVQISKFVLSLLGTVLK